MPSSGARKTGRAPGLLPSLAWLLGLMLVTGFVRVWSPIDRWYKLLGFFIIGIMAARRLWRPWGCHWGRDGSSCS